MTVEEFEFPSVKSAVISGAHYEYVFHQKPDATNSSQTCWRPAAAPFHCWTFHLC